jgi:predicted Zn-dependent protease with MMP-like domain
MKMDWERSCALATEEIEMILADLPETLREQVEKLPIIFERMPSEALQIEGIKVDTLGLFTGPEFMEEGHIPMSPQIILFLENLWNDVEGDEKAFREEIWTAFFHELGHYLGLDEDDLAARGLE